MERPTGYQIKEVPLHGGAITECAVVGDRVQHNTGSDVWDWLADQDAETLIDRAISDGNLSVHNHNGLGELVTDDWRVIESAFYPGRQNEFRRRVLCEYVRGYRGECVNIGVTSSTGWEVPA